MYTIGEIAKIIGISRDKLRYYEEKGIIAPNQDETNQYRQYGYEDILGILSIDYYRSLDMDFKTIDRLHSADSIVDLREIIAAKRAAVVEEIARLGEIESRIGELLQGCDMIEAHRDSFSIRALGPLEILGGISDFAAFGEFEAIHQVRNQLGGTAIIKSMVRQLDFDDSGLLGSKMLIVRELEPMEAPGTKDVIQFEKCVYRVVEDGMDQPAAIEDVFAKTKLWMGENQLKDLGVGYLRMILIAPKVSSGRPKSYLELFVPVE